MKIDFAARENELRFECEQEIINLLLKADGLHIDLPYDNRLVVAQYNGSTFDYEQVKGLTANKFAEGKYILYIITDKRIRQFPEVTMQELARIYSAAYDLLGD